LPSGITCTSFSPASVTPTSAGATSILTISVASSVAAGSYSVMVTGSPLGATTRSEEHTSDLKSLALDLVLSLHGHVSITVGSSVTVMIPAQLTGGLDYFPTRRSSDLLPSGITCTSFSPASVTPTSAGATSILTISVASSVAAGSYSVMVTGSPLGATT